MEVKQIVAELDQEIARLKEAKALLAGGSAARKRGRPRGSTNSSHAKRGGKRKLTPEGRKRISEALKRRWAAQRKAKAAKAS